MSSSSSHLTRCAIAKAIKSATAPTTGKSNAAQGKRGKSKEALAPSRAAATPPPLDWPNVVVESLRESCAEFLHLIVGEANDLSKREKIAKDKARKKRKKSLSSSNSVQHSIAPTDLYASLRALGFDSFIPDAKHACAQSKQESIRRQKFKRQRRESNASTDARALQAEQERLFAQAALVFGKQMSAMQEPKASEDAK